MSGALAVRGSTGGARPPSCPPIASSAWLAQAAQGFSNSQGGWPGGEKHWTTIASSPSSVGHPVVDEVLRGSDGGAAGRKARPQAGSSRPASAALRAHTGRQAASGTRAAAAHGLHVQLAARGAAALHALAELGAVEGPVRADGRFLERCVRRAGTWWGGHGSQGGCGAGAAMQGPPAGRRAGPRAVCPDAPYPLTVASRVGPPPLYLFEEVAWEGRNGGRARSKQWAGCRARMCWHKQGGADGQPPVPGGTVRCSLSAAARGTSAPLAPARAPREGAHPGARGRTPRTGRRRG